MRQEGDKHKMQLRFRSGLVTTNIIFIICRRNTEYYTFSKKDVYFGYRDLEKAFNVLSSNVNSLC